MTHNTTNAKEKWVDEMLRSEGSNWRRIDTDTYGNPRFILHFMKLIREDVLNAINCGTGRFNEKYAFAYKIAKKAGGSIYRGKRFSYHFVFQSWSDRETFSYIYDAMKEISDKAIQTGIL